MSRTVGALLVVLVAIVAGIIGFQAGVAADVAGSTAAAPAAYWYAFPHFFGFGGFLFFFLIVLLLFAAFGGRRRAWGGPRNWGGYGPMGEGDPRRDWIADAHRRLHEEEARGTTQPRDADPGTGQPR